MASSFFNKIYQKKLTGGCPATAAKILYQIKKLNEPLREVNITINQQYIAFLTAALTNVINYDKKSLPGANYQDLEDLERDNFKSELAQKLFEESENHKNSFLEVGESSLDEKPRGLVNDKGICYNVFWKMVTVPAPSHDWANSSYEVIKKTKTDIIFPLSLFESKPLEEAILNFILNGPYKKIINREYWWAHSHALDKADILRSLINKEAKSNNLATHRNIMGAFSLFSIPGIPELITSFLPDERHASPSLSSTP